MLSFNYWNSVVAALYSRGGILNILPVHNDANLIHTCIHNLCMLCIQCTCTLCTCVYHVYCLYNVCSKLLTARVYIFCTIALDAHIRTVTENALMKLESI